MDIDIYILNLPRDTYRYNLCYKNLCAKGVPIQRIHTWVANDDRDYEKTRQVCEAAIADGFLKYQSFLDRGEHDQWNIAIFAQSWNYCRFFRHLIDEQKTALLIHDDVGFGNEMTYEILNEMVECLQNRDEVFRYLTLWAFGDKRKKDYAFVPENPHIVRGIYYYGCDMAQVITPQGAALLLSKFEGYFPPQLEDFILKDWHQAVGFYAIYAINEESPLRCQNIIHYRSNIFIENVDHYSTDVNAQYIRPIETTRD